MTEQEYAHAQAVVAERENEMAALAQTERDCVDQVRIFADGRRQAAAKRVAIDLATKPLREAMAGYVAEQRRKHAEAAQAAAEAKAKEPQPPNPLEALAAEVKQLREQLAAKG